MRPGVESLWSSFRTLYFSFTMSKSSRRRRNGGEASSAGTASSSSIFGNENRVNSKDPSGKETIPENPIERIPRDGVQHLLREITNSSAMSPIVVQVIDVKRFFCNSTFSDVTGLDRTDDCGAETYDLFVSDGHRYMKMLLDPRFNHAVNRSEIKKLSILRILKGTFRYDELDSRARDPIMIIQDFSVVQRSFPTVWLRTATTQLVPVENSQGDDYDIIPTVHVPYTYMHPTRADSYPTFDGRWKKKLDALHPYEQDTLLNTAAEHELNLAAVADPTRRKNSRAAQSPALPLRVLAKSQIKWYKPVAPRTATSYPLQAVLLVGDHTGTALAVLWQSQVVRYYHALHVGDVVIAQQYKVKHGVRSLLYPAGLAEGCLCELNFNPSPSAGKESLLHRLLLHVHDDGEHAGVSDYDAVLPYPMPRPYWNGSFCGGAQLRGHPDAALVGVAGVVVCVGRETREQAREGTWVVPQGARCYPCVLRLLLLLPSDASPGDGLSWRNESVVPTMCRIWLGSEGHAFIYAPTRLLIVQPAEFPAVFAAIVASECSLVIAAPTVAFASPACRWH
eukprot:m.651835 g.651835  ORF g.651835 m.651835 type:complete len:564 (+) comp22682_c0_seq3:151-1842(+)